MQIMSLISSIKTPYPIINCILATLLPYLFTKMYVNREHYITYLYQMFGNQYYYRYIDFWTSCYQNIGHFDNDHLINAIDHYITICGDTNRYAHIDLKANLRHSSLSFDIALHNPSNWVRVAYNVEIKSEKCAQSGSEVSTQLYKMKYILRSKVPGNIEKFINVALDSLKSSRSDSTKYIFDILGCEKQYINYVTNPQLNKLNAKDIYSAQKDKILNMAATYDAMGKQLSMLFSGPPGTGKTSMIKLIAKNLNRHIICIDLSKIKNMTELLHIMNYTKYGTQYNINIEACKEFVFIFEDIDATDFSSVISARERTKTPEDVSPISMPEAFLNYSDNKNTINLSNILNLLDGVTEYEGRLIIMTTNHPEKLDPALLRPGRVAHFQLNNMTYVEARAMLATKYVIDDCQNSRLKEIINTSPAKLKELMSMYDTIEEILLDINL